MLNQTIADVKVLFALVAAGDETAFKNIFHLYNRSLYPFILKLVKSEADAVEIVQDVFLKLWQHRKELTGIENPSAWLYSVAKNKAYDHLRKMARYELMLSKAGEANALIPADADTEDTTKHILQQVMNYIRTMPLRRRQIYLLIKIEGFSRKEVAEELQISENTVRNQLAEAEKQLKLFFGKVKPVLFAIMTLCAAGF